jgi:hypothetical protein
MLVRKLKRIYYHIFEMVNMMMFTNMVVVGSNSEAYSDDRVIKTVAMNAR